MPHGHRLRPTLLQSSCPPPGALCQEGPPGEAVAEKKRQKRAQLRQERHRLKYSTDNYDKARGSLLMCFGFTWPAGRGPVRLGQGGEVHSRNVGALVRWPRPGQPAHLHTCTACRSTTCPRTSRTEPQAAGSRPAASRGGRGPTPAVRRPLWAGCCAGTTLQCHAVHRSFCNIAKAASKNLEASHGPAQRSRRHHTGQHPPPTPAQFATAVPPEGPGGHTHSPSLGQQPPRRTMADENSCANAVVDATTPAPACDSTRG